MSLSISVPECNTTQKKQEKVLRKVVIKEIYLINYESIFILEPYE